jgi:hypothetical protein
MGFRAWFEVALVLVALVGWRRELDGLWNTVAPRLGAWIEAWFRKKPGA